MDRTPDQWKFNSGGEGLVSIKSISIPAHNIAAILSKSSKIKLYELDVLICDQVFLVPKWGETNIEILKALFCPEK